MLPHGWQLFVIAAGKISSPLLFFYGAGSLRRLCHDDLLSLPFCSILVDELTKQAVSHRKHLLLVQLQPWVINQSGKLQCVVKSIHHLHQMIKTFTRTAVGRSSRKVPQKKTSIKAYSVLWARQKQLWVAKLREIIFALHLVPWLKHRCWQNVTAFHSSASCIGFLTL